MRFARYLLLALAALFLQATIIPFFAIRDIQPDVAILVVVLVSVREGRFWGTISGFAIGLALDGLTTEFFGLMALTKAVAGYAVASYETEVAVLQFRRWVQLVASAALIDRFLYDTIFSLGGGASLVQNWVTLTFPALLYTLAVTVILTAVAPREFLKSNVAKL